VSTHFALDYPLWEEGLVTEPESPDKLANLMNRELESPESPDEPNHTITYIIE
jgi:hypothetical protein